jgi:hypothetical protein
MIVCTDPLGHCEGCSDEAISKRDCRPLRPERHAGQELGLAMTAPDRSRVNYFMPSVIDGNVSDRCKGWGKDISVNVITSRMG